VGQHREGAIVFGARQPPAHMFAGEQPALTIAGEPVRLVRRAAVDADLSGDLVPTRDAVHRRVRPQQVAAVAKPARAFGPAVAGGEALERGVVNPVLVEARIEGSYRRVRVALARLPGAECTLRECRGRNGARAGQQLASVNFHGDPLVRWLPSRG